jgi:cyclomaltodextrinase / maltogenic alpha-amylase / neopullulanase
MSDWTAHNVFWHVYPLGFTGAEKMARADGAVVHRLPQLIMWLDYAVDLGTSGLLLGPIFQSSSHGYDTTDYYVIDPRLGDGADFDALIAAAHRRGLHVVLDGVFNHVGRDFPAFQRAIAQGPTSPDAGLFRIAFDKRSADGTPSYRNFEGHEQLPALNHDNPAVADLVVEVMKHWLTRGADGWRLDAAYAVPRPFWASVLPRVRADFPDAYIFGEVIHGDYAGFVRESTVDSVTEYELWKAIWSGINERNFFELSWTLARHNTLLDSFVPLTFIGNHDVTRIASRIADERHLPHALVVLLTTGGMPCIYYGDEQAFRGIKEDRAGGDDAIRPAFPASPDDLAPYGWPIYRLHQTLIGMRRRHPWLHRARTHALSLSNTQFVYEAFGSDQRITVALNLGDDVLTVRNSEALVVLAAGDGATIDQGQALIPGHGWAVLL